MKSHIIINGKRVDTAAKVTTWLDNAAIVRFAGDDRNPTTVNEILVHESVTSSRAATERVLQTRGLGVHLMVAPCGSVTQHADLATSRLCHAGGHNGPSIAIEVVNPYYGKYLKAPWTRVIQAGWADRGSYLVPTIEQCESVTLLVDTITQTGMVPREWLGLAGQTLAMSKLPVDRQGRQPGIWAHTYFAHADGAFPVLYTILRLEHKLNADATFKLAIELATTAKKTVNL